MGREREKKERKQQNRKKKKEKREGRKGAKMTRNKSCSNLIQRWRKAEEGKTVQKVIKI